MADDVKIGSASIDIRADDSKLKSDYEKAKTSSKKAVDDMNAQLSKIKMSADASALKMKFEDAVKWQNDLRAKLEKQIKMNYDVGTIQRTKAALDSVSGSLSGMKKEVSETAGVWDKIKGIGASLGLAYGVSEMISFTKEAVIASAELEVLRANFKGTAEDIELFKTATAGTVSEANLIKLSNQATDLGISLQDQAILFSLAEDSADKYGIGVEEGMTKVIAASEGSRKGLKALGIQKAVYEELVKSLSKAEGDSFKNLDAETQKQIQVQAILKATGMTIEEVKNKLPDAKDKIEQFYVGVEELKTGFGEIVREGLPQFIEMMIGVATNTLPAIEAQNQLNQAIELEMKLRKMQKDLYKDTVSYVGDLAEKEAKGKNSSQLTSMIGAVQEKISNMKKWAQKSGFTDDTKNDLEQQQRRLDVYSAMLNAMKEKDVERSKKIQKQKDKDLQIEKEYYAAVGEAGSVSLEAILKNVDHEIEERYKKLSEGAKKEVDLEKWKAAERLKAEEEYHKNVIEKSAAYQKSKALVEGKTKPKKDEMLGVKTLGESAPKGEDPFIKTQRDITDEINASAQAEERFAQSIAGSLTIANTYGKNFVDVLADMGIKFTDMVLQALVFKGIMATLNLIPGVGSALSWLGLGGHEGGTFTDGARIPAFAEGGYILNNVNLPKFAGGVGSYMVPNGYPNDSFPVMVQSGEDLRVRTPQQRAMAEMDNKAVANAINGLNKAIRNIASGNGEQSYTNNINLDGETIAVNVTKHQNRMARRGKNLSEIS